MAGLPLNFAIPAENAIASYNYTDISEGTGIQVFYGCDSVNSVGTTYIATGKSLWSANTSTTVAGTTSGTMDKYIDADFDVTFNTTKTIVGDAYVNMCFAINSATTPKTGYIIFKVRKYSGGVETDLGTVQSATLTGQSNATVWRPLNMKVAIAQTEFVQGDILRLTVEAWMQSSNANGFIKIYHDPKGRADDIVSANYFSVMAFHIPQKLNP